jgi:isopentenyl phosphate kinase
LEAKPVILKLGGSVITVKKKEFTPNNKAISRLAREIRRANVKLLVIVHGGGSFGHPLAKKHKLTEGLFDASQLIGFSETHYAMDSLNRLVVKALIKNNISAVGLQPSACIVTQKGRVRIMQEKPLMKLLEIGCTPVLYGDVVSDIDLGFTVLSGDQLSSVLALKLDASRIIMGVDVDGLFTGDPKTNPLATLIKYVSLKDLKNYRHKIEKSRFTDVTGGMLGKMFELTPAALKGIQITIINALKPNNVYKALKGERVIGTNIGMGS